MMNALTSSRRGMGGLGFDDMTLAAAAFDAGGNRQT